MLFSKKFMAKVSPCRNNHKVSSLSNLSSIFEFVILSEAKDLLFVGQSPNHSGEEKPDK